MSILSSGIIYYTDSSPSVYLTPLSGCTSVNHPVWQIPRVGQEGADVHISHLNILHL